MNEQTKPPIACMGVIMDGNRRWAKALGKPVFEGHRAGYETLEKLVRWAREAGIPHVVAYTFSTENWQRSVEEVGYLMALFRAILEKETAKMVAEKVRVRFVGDRSRFDPDLQKMMADMEAATGASYDVTLHLLMSYGGRAEIMAAVNALLAEGKPSIDENDFEEKLWSHPMPEPDLIIRTGGEQRLSNFLPWQSVYSELFFVDTLWPAFTKEEFNSILSAFGERERRRGK